MRTILIGMCALGLFAGLASKTTAQTVTMTIGPPTAGSGWVGVTNISVGFGMDLNFKATIKGTHSLKNTF